MTQPENVVCKPGDKVGFTIETSPAAKSYQWKLNGNEISNEDMNYEGSTSEHLSISKCLPKHKGSYKCVITTQLDTSLSSEIATLKIGENGIVHFLACTSFLISLSLPKMGVILKLGVWQ